MKNILFAVAFLFAGMAPAQEIEIYKSSSPTCGYFAGLPNSLKPLTKAAIITKNDWQDSCLYPLIAALADSFVRTSNVDYLICLDSICKVTDPTTGIDISGVEDEMFFNNFIPFMNYLAKNPHKTCLETNLFYAPEIDSVPLNKRIDDLIVKQEELNKNIPAYELDFIKEFKIKWNKFFEEYKDVEH